MVAPMTLPWRHNDHNGVSNHQPHGCLLNRLFRRRSKKTSKLRVTGLCVGNSPGPVNSPHKGLVTRKTFPFDDVIMDLLTYSDILSLNEERRGWSGDAYLHQCYQNTVHYTTILDGNDLGTNCSSYTTGKKFGIFLFKRFFAFLWSV